MSMKKILPKRGLSFKMVILICSVVIIIITSILGYLYFVSHITIKKNLKENSKLLTLSIVNRVERILTGVQKVPDNLAKVVESSDYTEEELFHFMKLVVQNNPDVFGMAIAFEPYYFKKNSYYFSPYVYKYKDTIKTTFLGGESYDYFTMDWYEIPKELDRPIWSEPYFDEGGGNIVMSTYSVPIYKNIDGKRKFVGILTADISLDWLHNIFEEIKVYKTGYAFMISKNGSIVTHPRKDLIMNETIFSIAEETGSKELRVIGRNMIQGKSSFAELEYHNITTGKLSWISYAPVSLNGWSVGIVYPVEEFTEDLNNLFTKMIILGISGSLILLFLIIYISRSITKPLRQLAIATEQFGEGNFNVSLPEIKSKDEIADLTKSFSLMQDALTKTIGELWQANDELENYSRTLEEKVEDRTFELKEKNILLDKAFNNVKTLGEIGQKITSTLKMESIFNTVYKSVNSLMDASSFLIFACNEETNTLDCKLSIENGERLPEFSFSLDDKNRFAVWSVINRQPVFMNDVDIEYSKYIPTRVKPKAGLYASSIIYLPLIVKEKVIGVISAQSFKKNAYNENHLDILSTIASYTAIALDNAYAYERINKANKELKEAQAQLIQVEKMASLGQLTAGIAHEIKNPLNFITNFAELTSELVQELTEELEKEFNKFNKENWENLKSLIADIEQNVKKIDEHGKRADSIVKGMLLHSRGKAGEMQKTNINDLLSEYVNLAYHGFRAQDSTFNVKIETNYDKSIPKINVVPQNISRVFLNILNNACYSVHEKKKEFGDKFNPVLSVTTIDNHDKIYVKIRDNGKGIPKDVLDKVFNPFFTTKPTGKGTGLGLSLSFDIVVQEHKGELKVESEPGEYAEFVITIPKNL